MSNIENNELWQAFFTEVSEQLDNLELILADNAAENNADINQLFRDFHTIKSSCAMMDFHSMEKIAHASEDYLDLVRKGLAQLSAPVIAELLNGIDWLKSQLKQAKANGVHPQENSALVETLRSLSTAITSNSPDITTNSAITNERKIGETPENTLSIDEIKEFSSAFRQELPIGLAPDADEKTSKRALNKLVSICNLLGFSAVSALLKKYTKEKSQKNSEKSTQVASEIIERILLLEKTYSVDCGSIVLRNIFLDAIFVDFAQLSGRMDYLLDIAENHPDDPEALKNCEELLSKLSINSSLFGYSELPNFFRYVLQVIRSIRRGSIPGDRTAFMAIRQAMDFPVAEMIQDGESNFFAKEIETRLTDLNYGIAMAMHSSSGDNIKELIAESITLDKSIIDLLMPDSLSELYSAILAEKIIYEVDVNLGPNEEACEKIIETLSTNSDIIHSRSAFSNDSNAKTEFDNCICFIVATRKDLPDLFPLLNEADRDNKNFICRGISKNHLQEDFNSNKSIRKSSEKLKTDKVNEIENRNSSSTLRIESHTLDDLITQAGEMIMAHNSISHEINDKNFEKNISFLNDFFSKKDTNELSPEQLFDAESSVDYLIEYLEKIYKKNHHIQKSSKAIQDRIMDLRVIPVSSVFNRIPSLVRKMADSQGKLINLVIEGKDVRIDKGMVDILMEPLIHLVRNCIDHGIETPSDRLIAGKPEDATLTLSASQEGSTLVLEISDNGRGINLDKIRKSAISKGFIQPTDILSEQETCKLIFLPGFSTADVITETSGRGVGMDVVITRINHIGGDIDVQTNPGFGTRFIMTLPLSAAIQSVIMFEVGSKRYAIPQSSISQIISINPDSISSTLGKPVIVVKNSAVPLFSLKNFLSGNYDFSLEKSGLDSGIAIVIGQNSHKIGLIVDKVFNRTDVFVRELHRDLRAVPTICGATTVGNGELVFIINSNFLLKNARQVAQVAN